MVEAPLRASEYTGPGLVCLSRIPWPFQLFRVSLFEYTPPIWGVSSRSFLHGSCFDQHQGFSSPGEDFDGGEKDGDETRSEFHN